MAFEVEYFTLDSTDSTNQYVSLTGMPLSNVALDIIGGTAQAFTGDFGVDGTKVKWDNSSYNLYGQVLVNDQLRVIYDKS